MVSNPKTDITTEEYLELERKAELLRVPSRLTPLAVN